ncbi:MAG: TonB-dependent receptor [Proteobacteria bacterium]|nr:TonB-dependent receptor [Pseudomonadota bacterium]
MQSVSRSNSQVSAALALAALTCTMTGAALGAAVAADGGGLEEVVVTAQKVTEDVRKVPASISVLSATDIADQHMSEIADLTRSVPNLSFSTQGGPGNQNIELRGISSTAGSSTVAVYLDDIPLTVRNLDTQGQVEPSFFDLQRVEVLRGPQGTLYGASSEGGTIRYISSPVNLEQVGGEAFAEASWTKHGGSNYQARAIVNLPIIEGKLGVRGGILATSDSGYVDHYSPDDPSQLLARGVNGNKVLAARLALEWRPSAALDIKPSFLYQSTHTADLDVLDLGSPDLLSQHKRVVESGKDTLFVPSLTVNYDLDGADLTSVTSYFYRYFDRWVDGTFYGSGYIGSVLDGAGLVGLDGNLDGYKIGNVPLPVHYRIWTQQFSQELRITSRPYAPGGSKLTWIAGAFYSDQKLDSHDYEVSPGLNAAITATYGPGFLTSPAFLQALGNPTPPVFPNDQQYLSNKLFNERQMAVFGEATWHVTPALRATAGLRYLTARTSLLRVGDFYFALGSPPALTVVDHARPTTPKFSLSYDLDADTTTYLTASKGFRLGGPNRPLPSFCPSTPEQYGPDFLWNYEAGVKSRLLNGTLAVSADAFYIDWKNIQVDINLPCTFDYNTNAGTARSYGSEAEIRYKPVPSLTLGVAGGYTNATLTSDVPALAITRGQAIPGVPRWSVDLSTRYDRRLAGDVSGFATADWNYIGSSYGTVGLTDPDYRRPSYALMTLGTGVNYRALQVSLFARNVFNDQKIIQRPNLQTVNRGYTLTPRTIGLSVQYQF